MTNDTQSSPPSTKRSAQTSGPLPLHFHVHRGRLAVPVPTDHSLRQNPKAGTVGLNGYEWPKVEREKLHPSPVAAASTVEGVAAMVTTTADGTPYVLMQSGAVRKLTHTDDGLVFRRRMTKAEKKAAKRAQR